MSLSLTLHKITWQLDRQAEIHLKRNYGVSFSWFRVLSVLDATGPSTQHRLAENLSVSDAAVSRLAERMAASGYLLVESDASHQRKHIVTISKNGADLVRRATKELEALLAQELQAADIDGAEYDALNTRLLEQLNKSKDRPGSD